MSTRKLGILIFLVLIIAGSWWIYTELFQKRISNIAPIEIVNNQNDSSKNNEDIPLLSTVATNLEVPWALVFLPDKSILFTERNGNVRFIDKDGNLQSDPVMTLSDVKQTGESGLHGITIHPNFSENNYVYLYFTYAGTGNETLNRVIRTKFENNTLTQSTIIVDRIPGAIFHDGGRLKFGPDGFLYISTGDAQEPSLSQNTNSLAGKILRVTDEGQAAPGNPFGNEIYSYGHRNPQGITWDDENNIWVTEHGSSAMDELNMVEIGKNYGWPEIRGDQSQNGMEVPKIHSRSDTWAPGGAAFLNGSVFFTGLRGQALYEAEINGNQVSLKEHLKGSLGRIRDVVVGPDNMLYITTSNHDGRGNPDNTDDKIIRVNPEKL